MTTNLHTSSRHGQERLYAYLYMAEMAVDCVQSVETWEWRICSQHPARPTYAKFEASSVNSPHNQATVFSNQLDSAAINFGVCSVFQIRWNTYVGS
jgi:hypothetical protein